MGSEQGKGSTHIEGGNVGSHGCSEPTKDEEVCVVGVPSQCQSLRSLGKASTWGHRGVQCQVSELAQDEGGVCAEEEEQQEPSLGDWSPSKVRKACFGKRGSNGGRQVWQSLGGVRRLSMSDGGIVGGMRAPAGCSGDLCKCEGWQS